MTTYQPIPSRPGYLAGADGSIIGKRGHVLKQARDGSGYLCFRYSAKGGIKITVSSHVAVCEAWHGGRPSRHEVAHLNGNRDDNRAANLTWKTRADNHADKIRHGTAYRGDSHHWTKITDGEVCEIRASCESSRTLAVRYGTSAEYIRHIRSGYARKNVIPE